MGKDTDKSENSEMRDSIVLCRDKETAESCDRSVVGHKTETGMRSQCPGTFPPTHPFYLVKFEEILRRHIHAIMMDVHQVRNWYWQMLEQVEQSKFRKVHHITVLHPLKPGEVNTNAISRYPKSLTM